MNKQTLRALETLRRLEQEKIESLTSQIGKIQKHKEEAQMSKTLAIEKMSIEGAYADAAGAYLTASHFSKAIQDKILSIDEDIDHMDADLVHLREDLGKYYNRLKTFEILSENGRQAIKVQEEAEEQRILDEIATTTFLRRRG